MDRPSGARSAAELLRATIPIPCPSPGLSFLWCRGSAGSPDVTQRSDLPVLVEMEVSRYGDPGAVAARPVVGVTAPARLAVGRAGVEAPMDDREIAQQADSHVLGHEPAERHRLRRQPEKLGLVEQRAVWSRHHEVVGQNLLETLHIPLLH